MSDLEIIMYELKVVFMMCWPDKKACNNFWHYLACIYFSLFQSFCLLHIYQNFLFFTMFLMQIIIRFPIINIKKDSGEFRTCDPKVLKEH